MDSLRDSPSYMKEAVDDLSEQCPRGTMMPASVCPTSSWLVGIDHPYEQGRAGAIDSRIASRVVSDDVLGESQPGPAENVTPSSAVGDRSQPPERRTTQDRNGCGGRVVRVCARGRWHGASTRTPDRDARWISNIRIKHASILACEHPSWRKPMSSSSSALLIVSETCSHSNCSGAASRAQRDDTSGIPVDVLWASRI